MPWFCLRVDVDFVPWDAQDPAFPAQLLRLWALARENGWRLHHFFSTRTLQALPSLADGALNEGHDLDWFSRSPEPSDEDWKRAQKYFSKLGHKPQWTTAIQVPPGLRSVPDSDVWKVDVMDLDGLKRRVDQAIADGWEMRTLRTATLD